MYRRLLQLPVVVIALAVDTCAQISCRDSSCRRNLSSRHALSVRWHSHKQLIAGLFVDLLHLAEPMGCLG